MNLLNDQIKAAIDDVMKKYSVRIHTDADIRMYVLTPLLEEFERQVVAYADVTNQTKPSGDRDELDNTSTAWHQVELDKDGAK